MWKMTLQDGTVMVAIANCAGTSEATRHVEAVLGGLWAGAEGSKCYAIYVREAHVEAARGLLRNDPEKERFHVHVFDD